MQDLITGFQEITPYNKTIDLKADFVMVYGQRDYAVRALKWQEKGYRTALMTGVAWGDYQDYLDGAYDGTSHRDESQQSQSGHKAEHCSPDTPYMIPTISFIDYLTEQLKKAIDDGVCEIFLEEPEIFSSCGYSEAFKREWQVFYRELWQPPHEGYDTFYKASVLKANLYRRCLSRLSEALKDYAMTRYNRIIKIYAALHSIVNYTQWNIVSPNSLLCGIDELDGFIAQVWTGTSRCEVPYEGVKSILTFEAAIIEYGILAELTRRSQKDIYFLHDPVEDSGSMSWQFYKDSYLQTVAASLFYPEIYKYEIVPWPDRVFNGSYKNDDGTITAIPDSYRAELLVIMQALRNMKTDDIRWDTPQYPIGLLLSDSMMYQRFYRPDDMGVCFPFSKGDGCYNKDDLRSFSPLYGLTLPLIKHGIFLRPVLLDRVGVTDNFLSDVRLLILSYEFMKPLNRVVHNELAAFIANGGVLIYVGDDSDPYHHVPGWWNSFGSTDDTPFSHLKRLLSIELNSGKPEEIGIHSYGLGLLIHLAKHPSVLTRSAQEAKRLRDAVDIGLRHLSLPVIKTNEAFIMRRGAYVTAHRMASNEQKEEVTVGGTLINLTDMKLCVTSGYPLKQGSSAILYDLEYGISQHKGRPFIAASSMQADEQEITNKGFKFKLSGADGGMGVIRIYIGTKPKSVTFSGKLLDFDYDDSSGTVYVTVQSNPNKKLMHIEF